YVMPLVSGLESRTGKEAFPPVHCALISGMRGRDLSDGRVHAHDALTRQAAKNSAIPIYRWFLRLLTIELGTGLAGIRGASCETFVSCQVFRLADVGRIDAFTGNSSCTRERKLPRRLPQRLANLLICYAIV